ncbi:hypothetical protein [Haloferax massiliensis]|uniref:Domain of unknown function domain-containing protein n=1 Tax=Haloferax massiliensis TaxID=1476858 RepID=A0A0D6JMB3_9EURY|nr:hypothetical protein [Haloferax massiliensis]CQR49032.1 hypothetical protein BN996_00487 [Haloferax massiliensis]
MSNSETRGILTEADKEWLRGEKEYNQRQTEAKRRRDIRERVSMAMEDFELLAEHWSPSEMEKVLEDIDGEARAEQMITFLYIALQEHAFDVEHMLEEDPEDRSLSFQRALSKGIRNGKQHFGDDPGRVMVGSNVHLFEFPEVDDIQSVLTTEQWREDNLFHQKSVTGSEDEILPREGEEVAENYRRKIYGKIWSDITSRRGLIDDDFKEYEF